MRGFAHMDYTWANPRILYMGLPKYNMRGQTHAYYAWANPPWAILPTSHVYYAWVCPRVLYVGKTT